MGERKLLNISCFHAERGNAYRIRRLQGLSSVIKPGLRSQAERGNEKRTGVRGIAGEARKQRDHVFCYLQKRDIGLNLVHARGGAYGFTLLELLLATLLSTMVIGIVAVALSFCLRMWERHQNYGPNDALRIIELMTLQIGSFNAAPVRFDEGEEQTLFLGDKESLTLATNYSLKAISKGAPVVARYVYHPEEKRLYYSEMPFNPKDPDLIEELLDMNPNAKDGLVRFYSVSASEFSLEFLEKEEEDGSTGEKREVQSTGAGRKRNKSEGAWNAGFESLGGVLLRLTTEDGSRSITQLVTPGFLSFQSESLDAQTTGTNSAEKNTGSAEKNDDSK